MAWLLRNQSRRIIKTCNTNWIPFRGFSEAAESSNKQSKNPEELFLDVEINKLLQSIIDQDPIKVHDAILRKPSVPVLKLLTDEDLKISMESSRKLTEQRLQMPPIMQPRQDRDLEISRDESLQGCLAKDQRLVVTDISLTTTPRNRFIVVREADGVLRNATWDERDRINQTYFPLPGRNIIPPALFEPDRLQSLLDRNGHLYVLNRACLQFEPDNPHYLSIVNSVYAHILAASPSSRQLDILTSLAHTRHMGGLVLAFVRQHQTGCLVVHWLQGEVWPRLGHLLRLMRLVEPESKWAVAAAGMSVPDGEGEDCDDAEIGQIIGLCRLYLQHEPISGSDHKLIKQLLDKYEDNHSLNRNQTGLA